MTMGRCGAKDPMNVWSWECIAGTLPSTAVKPNGDKSSPGSQSMAWSFSSETDQWQIATYLPY